MPRAEHPAQPAHAMNIPSKERLRENKLKLFKREQMLAAQGEQLQKELDASGTQEARELNELFTSSEASCARAELLLSERVNAPSKRVDDQLKQVQSELTQLQQRAADLDITPETVAMVKQNASVLKALEAAVGPARPQVIETSSTKEVLANMARQLEKKSKKPTNPFAS